MAAPEQRNEAFRERFFTSRDGRRLYFRDYGPQSGDRLAVLCLPGTTRNAKDFHGLARFLGTGRRVLCPDYRGRGCSEHDTDWRHYAPRTTLDDLRHLLASAGVHRLVAVGTSLGGLLAAGLAVALPTVLVGVVLNDIGPETGADALETILDHIADTQPVADWQAAADRLRHQLPDLPATTDDDWRRIAHNTFREENGRIVPDWDPAIARVLRYNLHHPPNLWPLFRALAPFPVLAFRGGKSALLSAETFARMDALIDDFTPITLPGVGHAPDLGQPPARDLIHDFIARLDHRS